MDIEDIVNYFKKNKSRFQKEYNILNFTIFGSYSKKTNNRNSDIDILYRLKDGYKLSFEKYLELENELKKAFKTKIDLINENKLNPLIKYFSKKDFIYV